ncbi:UNVERIFIED_CONTAM: hypothetical protein NCL1_46285 [Trichonephila clavipes]
MKLLKFTLKNSNAVLRIDADKTLRLSVAFSVYRTVPVRGSQVSVGGERFESMNCEVMVPNKVNPLNYN